MGVAEPRANRYGVLWVEDVRCGRVVNDDCLSEISANLGKILEFVLVSRQTPSRKPAYLDVVSLMIVAALAEQTMMHNMMYVKLIEQRISVLVVTVSDEECKPFHAIELPSRLKR